MYDADGVGTNGGCGGGCSGGGDGDNDGVSVGDDDITILSRMKQSTHPYTKSTGYLQGRFSQWLLQRSAAGGRSSLAREV